VTEERLLKDIFAEKGKLSAHIHSFEPRKGQMAMAEAVAEALDAESLISDEGRSGRILVVEAETGIGKTLAYLIPAVLSGKRIVVSTATLNLQDQIIKKEIPLVEKILGKDIPVLCVKGRSNYLCLYRWFQYQSNPQLSLLDDPAVSRIEEWLNSTVTGDRAELDWLSDKSHLWSKISAHSNQCLGSDCPEVTNCFITSLRKKAGAVPILIVNHHLFFSDLALRKGGHGEVLPRYEAVIFDEAHHIENVATIFFGKSFSQYQLIDFISDMERQAGFDFPPAEITAVTQAAQGLRQRIDSFMALFFRVKPGRFYLQDLIEDLTEEVWIDEVELLSSGLDRVRENLQGYGNYGESWKTLERRGSELNKNLREIALGSDADEMVHVRWYEKRERSVILSATPIDVADELKSSLYSAVSSCVMTSATLASGGSFSYLKERLGLDDGVEFLQFDSPFDYQDRSLLYIPEDSFPEPSSPEYGDEVCSRVLEILEISEGRALVLFTSFRGMERMEEYLDGRIGYPLLVQGTASRDSLLKSFREEKHSVLLAVASFWEGVDVVGESLSCVIIDKLPFEVPSDPVIKARIQHITENGGKPFFEFQVPRAVLSLRQGVGRLMRSASDSGIMAIMDVRLFKKGYGRSFLKSLPPAPVVRTTEEISAFFARMSE
jgi:ATP-dependent DNA helicase DinG